MKTLTGRGRSLKYDIAFQLDFFNIHSDQVTTAGVRMKKQNNEAT